MKRLLPHTPPRRPRGQATVEFVVLALVLVPLFIAIPLLGKYQDMFQATEAASRYVAFEGAVHNDSNKWKTDAELGLEVRRRFFSHSKAPVKTGDAAGDFAADRNPLWTDHAGNPLLASFEDAVQVHTTKSDKTVIAAAQGALGYADSLKLPKSNWYRAEVSLNIANVPKFKPFDDINLKTTRRTVLLTNAWTATSATQISDKIKNGGMKTYPLGPPVQPLVDLIGYVPTVVLERHPMRLGEFDWDVVPCDRLEGGC